MTPDSREAGEPRENAGGIQINFKRVANRAIRFWYLILLSLLVGLTVAYLVNRYTTRIYPVKASILIRESEENAGAKFLYNNELLTPYRNFYNEIYIMKSYNLLQEVVESLNFDVTFHREGEIKVTEYYDTRCPVKFRALPGSKLPYGKSMSFQIINDNTFSLQYISESETSLGKEFTGLHFNDSVRINGSRFLVETHGDLGEMKGKKFIVRFHDPLQLAKSYSKRLIANWAQSGASVVDLEITGTVAQKEVDFLNEFVEHYKRYDIEKKNKMASMAIRFLDDQLLIIGDSLKQYEDQVEDFKRRNIITSLEEETNRLYIKLQDLEEQKFQYRLLENYFNYISELLNNKNYEGIFTPISVGITDNVVAELINQLISEQAQVKLYMNNMSKGVDKVLDNPNLTGKQQKIEYLKNEILKTIENSRKTQGINIRFMNDQIKLVEDQLSKLPRTERELVAIQRNYSLKETLYVFLLQKRTEAGLSRASTTSDIVVVNPPIAAGSISPKISQNYAMAGVMGFLLPFIIFVVIELLNNRIQSKDDIERITAVPVIGGVGHNPAVEQLIVYNKPRSAMAESFRALRSNLNYFTGNKEHQIFMVTSSIPGEGKSFTTLNLASVFALAGKKTVIVGADLRKPKLFDELGLRNAQGLSQYLSGMATLDEILQASFVDNLYLISGGPMPPNPSELLLRPAMHELMTQLREQFDFVIVDTPPLSFVTDAFVLSGYSDHTLFIVRQDYTPKTALQALEEFHQMGKLTKISVLFNDLRKTGLGYGYGGHGYGYGYGYGYGGYGYGYGVKKKKPNGGGYYEE